MKLYEKKRCLNELLALLYIRTCDIHTIHGSLKNAGKASEWDIGKILKSMSKILMDSPARRETFEKSLSLMFIHCHIVVIVGTRMKIVYNFEIWPAFITFFKHLMKPPKTKLPAKGEGKSFLVLK